VVTVVLTVLGAELDECPRCIVLEDALEYERERNNYLLSIATKQPVDQESISGETENTFQSIRPRRVPWQQRRREVELKHRPEKVDIKPNLTQGEKIFEEELKNASKVS